MICRDPVYRGQWGRGDVSRWYALCIAPWMFAMLSIPGLTLLLLGLVVGLGTAIVWMLWEFEQVSKPGRNSDRFG